MNFWLSPRAKPGANKNTLPVRLLRLCSLLVQPRAIGATIHVTGAGGGDRSISADDFFVGLFATGLETGELVTAVYLGIPLFQHSQAKPNIAEGCLRLCAAKYLVLAKLRYSLTRTIDIVLLSLLVGETSVVLYAAAYRLCLLVQGIGQSLQTAYIPSLSRAARYA